MYCSNCGQKLPAKETKYCPQCGTKVDENATVQEEVEVVVGDKFPSPVFNATPPTHTVKTQEKKPISTPDPNIVAQNNDKTVEKPSIAKFLWLQTAVNLLVAYQQNHLEMKGAIGLLTILNLIVGLIFNKNGGKAGKAMKVFSALLALIQGGTVVAAVLNIIEYPFLVDTIAPHAMLPLAAFVSSLKMLFVKTTSR